MICQWDSAIKIQPSCWPSRKQTSSSFYLKVTCSCHDRAGNSVFFSFLSSLWRHYIKFLQISLLIHVHVYINFHKSATSVMLPNTVLKVFIQQKNCSSPIWINSFRSEYFRAIFFIIKISTICLIGINRLKEKLKSGKSQDEPNRVWFHLYQWFLRLMCTIYINDFWESILMCTNT